jgi:hypothetical protein
MSADGEKSYSHHSEKKQAVFCFEKSKTLEYSDFCFLAKTNWKFHAVPLMNGEDNKTVIPSKNST